MINWLLDHNLRELEKLKVSSYFQSDWKISQERIEILDSLPATVWTLKIIYPADTQRWNNVDSTLKRCCFNVVASG